MYNIYIPRCINACDIHAYASSSHLWVNDCTELQNLSGIVEVIIPPQICFVSGIYRGDFLKCVQL